MNEQMKAALERGSTASLNPSATVQLLQRIQLTTREVKQSRALSLRVAKWSGSAVLHMHSALHHQMATMLSTV